MIFVPFSGVSYLMGRYLNLRDYFINETEKSKHASFIEQINVNTMMLLTIQ